MFNLLWVIVTLALCMVLLRWRSPLLLFVPSLLASAFTTPFSDYDPANAYDAVIINLVMLGWLIVLVFVATYMRGRGVSLAGFDEVSANYAKMTVPHVFWLTIANLALVAAFSVWLTQAGIDQIESSKRARDSGQWFNLANALINVFVLHAVLVLSVFRMRLSNPHVVMAILTLALVLLIGYLSSRRGVFIMPMMIIFFVRLARTRSTSSRLKLISLFSIPGAIGLVMMALISAERRGDEDLAAGFQILGSQLSDSEMGYGLSPAKDAIVWEYSERRQVPEVSIVLLGGFYGLVPRALWPGKPAFVSTGPIAGAFVFRGQSYVDLGAGIPISMPSEISLAFGSDWFFPGLFAAALVMVLVAELLRPYPVLIFASLTFYGGLMAHGLPKSQVGLILDVATLLILCRATGIRMVGAGRKTVRNADPLRIQKSYS